MDETTIHLDLEPLEEGGFVATSPDVPGLVAEGRTLVETVELAQQLTRKIAESLIEKGWPLPPALRPRERAAIALDIPVILPAA